MAEQEDSAKCQVPTTTQSDQKIQRESRPRIWVDGDSCVKQVREYLIEKHDSRGYDLWLVSDRPLPIPPGLDSIHFILVPQQPDAADSYILSSVGPFDLVITRDILLAQTLVLQGRFVMNDRGVIHTPETITARVRERNTKQELRELGLLTKEKDRYDQRDFQLFCRSFDQLVTKIRKTKEEC